MVDASGAIQYANPLAETMFGFGRGALIGRSVEELIPHSAREQHAKERSIYTKDPTTRPMGALRQLRGLTADGREIPVEISLSPIDLAGSPCVLAVVRDVSEQRRFEEDARLRAVAVSAAANGIAITDAHGTFVWVNEAFTRLTGYTYDEVLGQSPRLLKSGRHDDNFYQTLWTTVLRGDIWQGETTNRRKDGSVYVEEQTIAPVRGEDGTITHFVAIKQDVTARREAEEALRQRVRELELLGALAHLGGSSFSADDILARSADLIGEALGLTDVRFVLIPGGTDATPFPTKTGDAEVELPMRVGTRTLGTMFASFPPDISGRNERERVLVTIAGQLATAIERVDLFAQLATLALTDALTSVHNRRSLIAQLELELSRSRRYNRPLSVLLLDIDHFKSINDVHGHATGDEVLRELTRRVVHKLRKMDLVGRYGGDEFVVILPDTDRAGACDLAERLRSSVGEELFITPSGLCRTTISIGVATIGEDIADIETLLEQADRALYEAKTRGRDRIVTANP
jgi:diguanylate cyclase (GGDEF)-like protein/PAS domain S-box-containing protein